MKTVITPIQIRFVDIDRMGHVNNAVYLSYLETARLHYFKELGGVIDWYKEGVILGRVEINYKVPITLLDNLHVKTWCTRIGIKSFDLSYSILKKDGEEEIEMANAITVMVCYDYALKKSIAIPGRWRKWLGE
jgi:acyl-CoA thioester hydrolase